MMERKRVETWRDANERESSSTAVGKESKQGELKTEMIQTSSRQRYARQLNLHTLSARPRPPHTKYALEPGASRQSHSGQALHQQSPARVAIDRQVRGETRVEQNELTRVAAVAQPCEREPGKLEREIRQCVVRSGYCDAVHARLGRTSHLNCLPRSERRHRIRPCLRWRTSHKYVRQREIACCSAWERALCCVTVRCVCAA